MPRSSRQVLKETIQTSTLTNGLLNPYQANKFLQQTFEQTKLLSLVRHEMRTERTGEIDKIGIGSRIVRLKTENYDDGYRASVNTGSIHYATVPIRLPYEITEETLRENIEGQNFESIVTNFMSTQFALDLEDLCLNGDEETDESDENYNFLKINDGWIKQLTNDSHNVDAGDAGGDMSLNLFYYALQEIPNKYNNGTLRWLMSPHRAQQWELYLYNQIVANGGAVPESIYNSPASIPSVVVPMLDDDKIILTNPKNFVVINTYNMKIRKADNDVPSIMEDKRFYVMHVDFDAIIEEADAACLITGLNTLELAA